MFTWVQVLSHRVFMPRMLRGERVSHQDRAYRTNTAMCHDLLAALFEYLRPYLHNGCLPESVCLLYKGTLRILLVLLHEIA